MINIRTGVFETNSSSVHSLVIRTDSWFDKPEYNTDDGHYVVKGGYYGRSPQLPTEELIDKLNYIWTMVNELYGETYNWDDRNPETGEYSTKIIDSNKYKLWQDMIHQICPKAELIPIAASDYNCGIDHAYNLTSFAEAIEKDINLLRYFLLSYSWIEVGGDEYPNLVCVLDIPWGELVKISNHTYIYVKGN